MIFVRIYGIIYECWGISAAGSPVEAVTHPPKNLIITLSPFGGIAQLGERLNGIQEVSGSIPLISTITRECD